MNHYKKSLLATLTLQSFLIFYAFRRFFVAPGEQMFCNIYDGFKNYLTYHAYVHQKNFGLTYSQMNYPFGDFITYTDNTPLVAILVKAMTTVFPSLANHDIVIFNFICLAGIVLSTYLLFKIFKFIQTPTVISIFFSIILPWISPQLERLNNGHFNLTFSWIILLGIWLLIRFYYARSHDFSIYKSCIGIIILTFCATYIHVYHVCILMVLMGGFAGLWWLTQFVQLKGKAWKHPSSILLMTLVASFVLSLMSLSFLDEKLDLRQSFAEGYGFDDWKLRWTSLIYSYEKFPFRNILGWKMDFVPYESYLYLGSVCILGFILFLFSIKKWFYVFEQAHTPFLLILGLVALMSFSIGMGEKVMICDYEWTNRLNPFYFLHKVTDRVEQFRCLSRFAWIFFWVANIGVVYFLGLIWNNRTGKILTTILMLIGMVEAYYFVQKFHLKTDNNVLQEEPIETPAADLLSFINIDQYQAILPVPFYHVGCENYDYTIDPEEDFFNFISELSLRTGLPSMGSKMSRTPIVEAQTLMSIFDTDIGQKTYLTKRLKKAPILVVFDKQFYSSKNKNLPDRMVAKKVVLAGEDFVRNLQKIGENERYDLFEWNPL